MNKNNCIKLFLRKNNLKLNLERDNGNENG